MAKLYYSPNILYRVDRDFICEKRGWCVGRVTSNFGFNAFTVSIVITKVDSAKQSFIDIGSLTLKRFYFQISFRNLFYLVQFYNRFIKFSRFKLSNAKSVQLERKLAWVFVITWKNLLLMNVVFIIPCQIII